MNNLKQMGLAMHNYLSTIGTFPPAKIYSIGSSYANYPQGVGLVLNTTGFTMILVALEQTALYNAYNFSFPSAEATDGGANMAIVGASAGGMLINSTVVGTFVGVYACPSDQAPPIAVVTSDPAYKVVNARRSNYLLCAAQYTEYYNGTYYNTHGDSAPDLAVFTGSDRVAGLQQLRDGTSNTCLIGEAPQTHPWNSNYGPYWAAGAYTSTHGQSFPASSASVTNGLPNYKYKGTMGLGPWQMGSNHLGGLNMLFGDGSVKFVKDTISPAVWYGLMTMKAGEILGSDAF